MRKILIMGLPGAGKTTLAKALALRLNAVHFNGDEVRGALNRDLGFSHADRIEQARRMGWLADQVVKAHGYAIADFVCPTVDTRSAFEAGGAPFVVWVDRIKSGRFEDTNKMFEPPERVDFRVPPEGNADYWAEQIAAKLRPLFDQQRPTALFVGRFQPFHAGHRQLIVEGLKQVGQACIGIRNVHGTSEKNPFGFEEVKSRIEDGLRDFSGRFAVIALPNITSILYGRDVGYEVRRLDLGEEVESISATAIRHQMAAPPAADGNGLGLDRTIWSDAIPRY